MSFLPYFSYTILAKKGMTEHAPKLYKKLLSMTNKTQQRINKVTDYLKTYFLKLSKKSQMRLYKLALITVIVTLPIWLLLIKSKEQSYFDEIKGCYSNGEAKAFYNEMVQEFTEYQNKNTKLHKALE